MPLDPIMTDAILGTFKNMVQEIKDKNLSGEDVDKMNAYYNRMVELSQIHSDMNAFNGQVMQENLYMNFSDHYGRVLSQAAMQQQEEKGYDDSTLLKQTVDALKNAIVQLEKGKQDAIDATRNFDSNKAIADGMDFAYRNGSVPMSKRDVKRLKEKAQKENQTDLANRPNMNNNDVEIDVLINIEPITSAIQNLIDLGEQEGMTLPRFLRIQIEKGLDRAAEGMVLVRDAYEDDYEFQKSYALSPYHIQKAKEKLETYDLLASQTKFNIPHNEELMFCDEKLDYKYERDIIIWDEIVNRWEEILDDLSHWSLAYTSVAPYIDPWKGDVNPKQATIQTQKIQPGIIKERLRLFKKYFDIDFMAIFKHPTFKWKVEQYTIGYSQEYIIFLIELVYPQCQPFNDLNSDTINERLSFYNDSRESNPEANKPLEKFIAYYDQKFGEGRYLSKFPAAEQIVSHAQPWDWETFRYKE